MTAAVIGGAVGGLALYGVVLATEWALRPILDYYNEKRGT